MGSIEKVKTIEINAAYGDQQKLIEISQPSGGGDSYQVMIDHYLQGTVVKRGGEWLAHLNQRSQLTGDDILIIGDIIDANNL